MGFDPLAFLERLAVWTARLQVNLLLSYGRMLRRLRPSTDVPEWCPGPPRPPPYAADRIENQSRDAPEFLFAHYLALTFSPALPHINADDGATCAVEGEGVKPSVCT